MVLCDFLGGDQFAVFQLLSLTDTTALGTQKVKISQAPAPFFIEERPEVSGLWGREGKMDVGGLQFAVDQKF